MSPSLSRSWPYKRCFAHRGGGTLAPENTLVALEVAHRYGVGVEFDVMLSADGTPVVIHDAFLKRTTDGRGWISRTRDEVLFAHDAGSWFAPHHHGARIPAMAQMVQRCYELGLDMNIELKRAPAGAAQHLVGAVADCLNGLPAPANALPPLISSFDERVLRFAQEAMPALPRGLLLGSTSVAWHARSQRLDVASVHVPANWVDDVLVEQMRAAGRWLVAYTENDPDRMRTLRNMGVDCVITDRPDLWFDVTHCGSIS